MQRKQGAKNFTKQGQHQIEQGAIVGIESIPSFSAPARQRWESIPSDFRKRLLGNVWCG